MTHKQAINLIQDNLERDAYTFSHVLNQYLDYRRGENIDLYVVKKQLDKLLSRYPSWIGKDGQRWFGEQEIHGASYRQVDEESSWGSQPEEE